MAYSDYIKIYIVNYIAVLFEWFFDELYSTSTILSIKVKKNRGVYIREVLKFASNTFSIQTKFWYASYKHD